MSTKMITKYFHKKAKSQERAISSLVTRQLRPEYSFVFCVNSCYVVSRKSAKENTKLCKAPTPRPLYEAWIWDRPISFSVSLPAKYWKA